MEYCYGSPSNLMHQFIDCLILVSVIFSSINFSFLHRTPQEFFVKVLMLSSISLNLLSIVILKPIWLLIWLNPLCIWINYLLSSAWFFQFFHFFSCIFGYYLLIARYCRKNVMPRILLSSFRGFLFAFGKQAVKLAEFTWIHIQELKLIQSWIYLQFFFI